MKILTSKQAERLKQKMRESVYDEVYGEAYRDGHEDGYKLGRDHTSVTPMYHPPFTVTPPQ